MPRKNKRLAKLVKKFPTFYANWKFITLLKSVRHLSLSRARNIHSMPPFHFLKIHFNIILPSAAGSFKWPLSLRFHHLSLVCTFSLPHTFYVPCQYHPSRFDLPNSVWCRTHYEAPHYVVVFTPLLPRPSLPQISPQHPMLKHPQPTFFPQL